MYKIEENSLQDHLRNYIERLKFVISSIFILCLHLPLLSHITSLLNCSSPSLLPRLFFPPAFQSHCHLPFLPPRLGNPRSAHSLRSSPLSLSPVLRTTHRDVSCLFPPLRPRALLLFHSLVQITHLVISPLQAYLLDVSVSLFVFKIKIIVIQRMLLKTQRIAIWRDLRTRLLKSKSNAVVVVQSPHSVQLFATPGTAAHSY